MWAANVAAFFFIAFEVLRMTEQETQAETTNVEVESQEASKPTFDELQSQLEEARESIKRLESNRDEILKEKRSKSAANQEAQAELEQAREEKSLIESNFKGYIENQMIESLIGEIAVEGSEDLWRHTLKSHVAVDVASQEYNFADEAGNALSKEGLIELLMPKHGQFVKVPKSSGADARGGSAGQTHSSSRVKSRSYADSFGLGK